MGIRGLCSVFTHSQAFRRSARSKLRSERARAPSDLRAPEGARFSYLKSPDLGFFLCGRRFSPGPDLGALARPLLRCRGLFERRKLSSMGVVIGLRMVVTGSSVSSTCAPCVTPVCPVCVPAPPVYFYRSTPGLRLFLRLLSRSRFRHTLTRMREIWCVGGVWRALGEHVLDRFAAAAPAALVWPQE